MGAPGALETVKAGFQLWEAIFEGRSLDFRDGRWHASGLKRPLCDQDAWQLIGGHFTHDESWRAPALIRATLQSWLPPPPGTAAMSRDSPLSRDTVRLALADFGLDLSPATVAAWRESGCTEEATGGMSKLISRWKHEQKELLYTDIATRFAPKPPEKQDFSDPYRPPSWRPDSPAWTRRMHQLITALQATPVTAHSARDQFNHAIADRGRDYAEEFTRLSTARPSRLPDLVETGGRIAVQQRFLAYVHLLHGPDFRDDTFCSPQKSSSGIHAQVRFKAEALIDAWATDVGATPRQRHVDDIGEALMKRADPPLKRAPHREQEKVLLDLAVYDVLDGPGHPFASALLISGCLEAMDRSARADRQFAARPRTGRSPETFGVFSVFGSDGPPSVRDRRDALAMMRRHLKETVDKDFQAAYPGDIDGGHDTSPTPPPSPEKPPDD